MENKTIKYIASYDFDSNKSENRVNALSSTNKINYILGVLNDLGYDVEIISTSHTMNKKCYSGKEIVCGRNKLHLFPTTWRGGTFFKIINMIVQNTFLCFFLLRHVKKGEKIMIYHSYGYLWIYYLLHAKGAKIISECEEIYGDIFGNEKLSKNEKKALKGSYAYIYPTRLLNRVVNKTNAPYLVVHGAYKDLGAKYFPDKCVDKTIFENGKCHVAYTGILDPRKGCIDFVRAAEYLDQNYHIHVLGFGGEDELKILNETISEVSKRTKCVITYDGTLKGRAYSDYLSCLNLGICTLSTDAGFISTQFPSKIISYLSAGVRVLCSDIEAIKTSDVAAAITFYSGNKPFDIAQGIVAAKNDARHIDTQSLLKGCDEKFHQELHILLTL